ncbi:hypothetical protein [Deinococcus sp. PEB2-63]
MNALEAIVQHTDNRFGTDVSLHFRNGTWKATVSGLVFAHLYFDERPRGVGSTPQDALEQLLNHPAWPEGREL